MMTLHFGVDNIIGASGNPANSYCYLSRMLSIPLQYSGFEVKMTPLDKIDIRILDSLTEQGRISISELSAAVGLSQTPTVNRIRKLEETGVIKGYQAHLSEALLGGAISVFIWVSLVDQQSKTLLSFEKIMEQSPEVMDCYLMTGDADYLLRVAVNGLEEFERFLTERLAGLSEVTRIRSSVALRPVVQKRRPPELSRQVQADPLKQRNR
jgi:DNA-binding Lrp family transcriptional regulator